MVKNYRYLNIYNVFVEDSDCIKVELAQLIFNKRNIPAEYSVKDYITFCAKIE